MKYIVFKATVMTVSAFFIICAPFLYFPEGGAVSASGYGITDGNIILLDAGHGGEDGGAVGFGGIVEKDINLSITHKTAAFLEFFGYDIEFTRTDDRMTCDEGLHSQRERKISDLKNRLEQINESACLCSISIHQNIFGGNALGAQVFFGQKNPESKELAYSIQSGIKSLLQPENNRMPKQVSKDIFLLYHAKKTAVLVECGFISNSSEAALLADETYQNKMAFAISVSAIKHLTEREV